MSEAQEHLDAIRQDRQTASELLFDVPAGELPPEISKRQGLKILAAEALKKPRIERSLDDFRALVSAAHIDEDWDAMEERASALLYLFGAEATDEILSEALISRVVALGRQGKIEEAAKICDEIIDKFDGVNTDSITVHVVWALYNRGVAYGKTNETEKAIATYQSVVDRYRAAAVPAYDRPIVQSLINLSARLGMQERYKEAVERLELAEQIIDGSQNEKIQEIREVALFNRASLLAKMNKVTEAVVALARYREFAGSLDCEKIRESSDFDTIRHRPTFRKFLKDNGCDPDAKPDDNPDPEPAAGPDSD